MLWVREIAVNSQSWQCRRSDMWGVCEWIQVVYYVISIIWERHMHRYSCSIGCCATIPAPETLSEPTDGPSLVVSMLQEGHVVSWDACGIAGNPQVLNWVVVKASASWPICPVCDSHKKDMELLVEKSSWHSMTRECKFLYLEFRFFHWNEAWKLIQWERCLGGCTRGLMSPVKNIRFDLPRLGPIVLRVLAESHHKVLSSTGSSATTANSKRE